MNEQKVIRGDRFTQQGSFNMSLNGGTMSNIFVQILTLRVMHFKFGFKI